jgi:hypothetical protein
VSGLELDKHKQNSRREFLGPKVGSVEGNASNNVLVGTVDVQDARVGFANPDNLGDFRAERRLGNVTAGNVQELPCSL